MPLRLNTNDGQENYQLYKLPASINKDIKAVIVQDAKAHLDHYQWEGKKFPPFDYTDVNGKKYTSANTAGKIVVLKSWFIRCQACNLEIPELNKLTEQYKSRKDVLFVSIAFDSKAALQQFLKKTVFNYAVVPVKESYISETLKSNAYPTHWVINKKGIIVKRCDNAKELTYALNKEAGIK